MPHVALNEVVTVQDVADYWAARLEAEAEVRRKEEEHWTRKHPSNVTIADARTDELDDWLATHGQSPRDMREAAQRRAAEEAEGGHEDLGSAADGDERADQSGGGNKELPF